MENQHVMTSPVTRSAAVVIPAQPAPPASPVTAPPSSSRPGTCSALPSTTPSGWPTGRSISPTRCGNPWHEQRSLPPASVPPAPAGTWPSDRPGSSPPAPTPASRSPPDAWTRPTGTGRCAGAVGAPGGPAGLSRRGRASGWQPAAGCVHMDCSRRGVAGVESRCRARDRSGRRGQLAAGPGRLQARPSAPPDRRAAAAAAPGQHHLDSMAGRSGNGPDWCVRGLAAHAVAPDG